VPRISVANFGGREITRWRNAVDQGKNRGGGTPRALHLGHAKYLPERRWPPHDAVKTRASGIAPCSDFIAALQHKIVHRSTSLPILVP
jgi:hypothetical protein